MESLYVCLFSNGHIKVGRSNDVPERVRQHAERVSCLGVSLQQHKGFPCAGNAMLAETALIALCIQAATGRHKLEWFQGLCFETVANWANACAIEPDPAAPADEIDFERPDFRAILRALKRLGRTQVEIATYCGCSQPSISDLANGVTTEPSYSIGAALVRLVRSLQSLTA